jgi:glycosyltransferase involved in cell wall biosynthesis
MDKRILIISYYFPPSSSPEAIQTGRFVKKLAKKGYQIDVVTSGHGDTNIGHGYPDNVKVYKTKRIKALENRYVSRLFHLAPLNQLFPDSYWWWFIFALNKSKQLIENYSYDCVYSRSQPFTSNLVGLYIKRKYRLKWIAHFSDPWIDSPFSSFIKFLPNLNTQWEKHIFQKADYITTPSYAMELLYKKKFEGSKDKIVTIMHMFDEDVKLQLKSKQVKHDQTKIRIVHAGMFYNIYRTPDLFIEALHYIKSKVDKDFVNKLEVIFLGKTSDIYKEKTKQYDIEGQFTYINRVDYLNSLEFMSSADILLLIDTMFRESHKNLFLPSKLIDYIGMGKPIIGMGDPCSVSNRILNDLSYPFIDIHLDPEAVYKQVYQALKSLAEGRNFVPEKRDFYIGEHPIEKFQELLERI